VSPSSLAQARLGFEAFGAASGLSIVVGALSVVAPYLTVLTATLALLAVAGWAVERRSSPRAAPAHHRTGVGLGVLTVASALFLDASPALREVRGLVLGLGVAGFWAAVRGRTAVPIAPHEAPR
jgi:hypothetical protein